MEFRLEIFFSNVPRLLRRINSRSMQRPCKRTLLAHYTLSFTDGPAPIADRRDEIKNEKTTVLYTLYYYYLLRCIIRRV